MVAKQILERIAKKATVTDQYKKQIIRVNKDGKQTDKIEAAVRRAVAYR